MDTTEYHIERVVCGDDSKYKNGVWLRKGAIYGSSQLQGMHESFFEINYDTLNLSSRNLPNTSYKICQLSTQYAFTVEKTMVFTILDCTSIVDYCEKLKTKLYKFMIMMPGTIYVIGGPGCRSVSINCGHKFIKKHGCTAWHENQGLCIAAALTNAVWSKRGLSAALHMKQILVDSNIPLRKFSSCLRMVHLINQRLQFERVRGIPKVLFHTDAWHWITSKQNGVFVFRIMEPKKPGHCVVLDTSKKILIDSAEVYPLELDEESLHICTGVSEDRDKVKSVELFEVKDQNK